MKSVSTARAGDARTKPTTIPAHILPHRSPQELLAMSRRGIIEAHGWVAPGQRYASAHLAALRAAAAVLAARARPTVGVRRSRPTNVWILLSMVAPELTEWATFFAAGAAKRAAAEAGISHVVTVREADDLVRDAERFGEVVATMLNLTYQPVLTVSTPQAS